MAIYRVSIRQYDDFPGHTHEFWEIFSAVVKTENTDRIREIVGPLPENQKLIIGELTTRSLEDFRKFWLNESKILSDD